MWMEERSWSAHSSLRCSEQIDDDVQDAGPGAATGTGLCGARALTCCDDPWLDLEPTVPGARQSLIVAVK